MRQSSYRNAGTLADCLADLAHAETVESRVACLRIAEVLNLLRSALTGK